MDKERLEELRPKLWSAEARELIAEVEFLTKVAEQMREWARFSLAGKGDSIYMDENPDRMTVESHPELAQYLKRGKE
jgi:hypothetical protein